MMHKGEIVKDDQGNHYLVVRIESDDKVRIESVATREVFIAPPDQLYPSSRVAF
jgi:hypothetical protein